MTLKKIYIATGFCADKKGEESHYPQVGLQSSSLKFQQIYLKCIIVFFATTIRQNPNAHHVLCTNLEKLPDIGNTETEKLLEQIGVEIVRLPFTFEPPEKYFNSWKSTFYKLDLVKYFSKTCDKNEAAFCLDSDCVWIDSIEGLAAEIQRSGYVTYNTGFNEKYKISHINRRDLSQLYRELGLSLNEEIPVYCGAELIAAKDKNFQKLLGEIERGWEFSLEQFKKNKTKFNTEEHLLNFAYNSLQAPLGNGNPYIDRIWTTLGGFNNASDRHLNLTIWHLPFEKKYGFKRLFEKVVDFQSEFWQVPENELAGYLSRFFGIPKRTPQKLIIDSIDALSYRGTKIISNTIARRLIK
jgi:hypothetical protein